MNQWNDPSAPRLLQLRLKELKGILTSTEAEELAAYFEQLEQEESRRLAPALATLEAEQTILRERLQQTQAENAELASLLSQQEQLVVEARRWLAEFRARHNAIQERYSLLTGVTLVA
jgi:hypothetical protein